MAKNPPITHILVLNSCFLMCYVVLNVKTHQNLSSISHFSNDSEIAPLLGKTIQYVRDLFHQAFELQMPLNFKGNYQTSRSSSPKFSFN